MSIETKVLTHLMARSKMSAFAVWLTPEVKALCVVLDGELAAIRAAQKSHAEKLARLYTADHGA